MKLLHVIHYPVFNGPHNQALRLAPGLAREGWQTTVLVPNEPGNAAERLRAGGVDVITAPLGRLRAVRDPLIHLRFAADFPASIQRIRRIIRDRDIDLVVIGGLVNPHGAIAARLENVPVVWQIVDSRTPAALLPAFMPVVRRLADSVMFDGESLVQLHVGSRPLEMASVIYYPPVDTAAFQPSATRRDAIRRELGIPTDATVVGMVANLNPQKGIEYFVRAAGIIYRSNPAVRFLLVGSRHETHGAYDAQIKAELEQTGIPEDQFVITGYRTDVEDCYAAMDVKLITSVPASEGTTTTAMEAMACGVPVVATDVGAVREVVDDSVTGFVVPPLDPEAIAAATLRVLNSPSLHLKMSEAAQKDAVERFDTSICVASHLVAFEAALAHHGAKRHPQAIAA